MSILNPPSERTLEALKRLSESQDWSFIKEWIEASQRAGLERLTWATGDEYRVYQGHAQMLNEVLGTIQRSGDVIAKKGSKRPNSSL